MLLIAGLGNPGPEYAGHRHNVGFMAVDAIHRRHGFGPWRRRFRGETAEGTIGGEKVLLLKPLTYMNESGRSVGEAMRFYKLTPTDVLVIHDEVDLPPGKLRMKSGGGAAGHNGLRSTSGAIGDGYRRMRIGVGHPGAKEAVPHYVLHDFAKVDRTWLEPMIEAIAEQAGLLAAGKDPTFANRIHEALGGDAKKPKATPAGKGADQRAAPRAATPDERQPAPGPGDKEGPLARGLKKLFGG
ncbi:MAG: aminoacyl-tRNA hydrolase [Bauldia sp.]|nr:aminoacyl-tRNA hydrolase [Bauldia sp.]